MIEQLIERCPCSLSLGPLLVGSFPCLDVLLELFGSFGYGTKLLVAC